MRHFPIGRVVIRWWHADFFETVWNVDTPAEVPLPSVPNYRPEDLALAAQLGYGTGHAAVHACWQEHDPIHSFLAVACGGDWSPTLHAAAHGYKLPRGLIPAEETDVLALQAYLCTTRLHPALVGLCERARCPLPDLAERARAFLAQFGA